LPIKDTLSWDMLALLMIEDMIHSDMNDHMLDELDEMFKGIAMNGQGIGIDFDEIRKAEEMYKDV
jgi:hypothetical protein